MEILYEDKDIIAINKPVGLNVHPDGKHPEETLIDWILEKNPELKNIGESTILADGTEVKRPGIVHRLDKDTSGVLLIAKTKEGYDSLKSQFKAHTIKKVYRAFVYGNLREERFFINRPIQRSANDFRKGTTNHKGRGIEREAQTRVRVLKHSSDVSYIEAMPVTGRKHQIRIHLKSIHHPVLNDSLYAKGMKKVFDFDRLALHAFSISFVDLGGKEIRVEASLPESFAKHEDLC